MKTRIMWALGIMVTVLVAANVSAAPLVLGRVSFDLRHPYQQADAKWFETFAKEKGISVITMDGQASAETMVKDVEDLISKKVDGIVIQPADNANADAVAALAHQANVPLVTFVNKALNAKAPNVELYEAETSMAMGKLAATKWKEWYPNKPMVIGVIDFPAIAQVHEQRALSFIKGVQSVDPRATVAAILDGAGVRDKSMASAEDLIQSHPEANIIYGINADSALGALAAYEAAGRGRAKGGVPLTEIIVSTDGSEQEAVKIYDPTSALKITMALSPKNFAKAHLDMILKVINKQYAIDQAVDLKVGDVVLDYWSTPIEKFQDFLTKEYFSKVNLKELMQKK